jgi:hypothetical protein
MLFNEFYQISIGASVIAYFHHSKDYLSLAKLTKWTILFILVTAIMTIVSSAIDPMYARNMAGAVAVTIESEKEAILSFKKLGGGTYSMAVVFMCLFPIIIYYYKNMKINLVSKKTSIVFFLILVFALLGMQIFANILIAIAFSVFALMGMKKIRKSLIVIILFLGIIIIIPKDVYISGLIKFSEYFEKDSELNYKFIDLAMFIELGGDIEDNTNGAAGRAERYPMLIDTFVKGPLFGCFAYSGKAVNGYMLEGGHLHWMNKLTTTGVFLFIFFIMVIYNFIKINLKYFDSAYIFYYILASLSIVSYGLIKAISGRETWYALFIILPGIYYLPMLKKTT